MAGLYPWGWETPDYDDHSWLTPKTLDTAHPRGVGTDINWELTPGQSHLWSKHIRGLQLFAGYPEPPCQKGFWGKSCLEIPVNRKIMILFDQEKLTTGYPELLVSGGKGGRLKLTYSESLFDVNGSKGNRNEIEGKSILGYSDYFLPDGNPNRLFRPLWFRTWRYLQMEIETSADPLTINSFSSEFTAYPLKENAVFDSDRPDLKKYGIQGGELLACANETYFDCPYYEQLQYVGDTRIQALISLYVSGDDRLVRNANYRPE